MRRYAFSVLLAVGNRNQYFAISRSKVFSVGLHEHDSGPLFSYSIKIQCPSKIEIIEWGLVGHIHDERLLGEHGLFLSGKKHGWLANISWKLLMG